MDAKLHPQADGGLVVEHAQDVEPVLEYAKERARSGAGMSASGEMMELAHFPAAIVQTYCDQRGITFADFMQDRQHVKNLLADPALRDFQVWANNPHKLIRGA